jgi:hypothetical protein
MSSWGSKRARTSHRQACHSPDPKIYLAPGVAEIYRQKIGELHEVITVGSEQV